jgi:hypothetical protein
VTKPYIETDDPNLVYDLTDTEDPIWSRSKIDMFEPNCALWKTLSPDPIRIIDRRDRLLPARPQSSTEAFDPNLSAEKTLRPDPRRA